jgi:hypothetical protein
MWQERQLPRARLSGLLVWQLLQVGPVLEEVPLTSWQVLQFAVNVAEVAPVWAEVRKGTAWFTPPAANQDLEE